jgi:hypothetical protein
VGVAVAALAAIWLAWACPRAGLAQPLEPSSQPGCLTARIRADGIWLGPQRVQALVDFQLAEEAVVDGVITSLRLALEEHASASGGPPVVCIEGELGTPAEVILVVIFTALRAGASDFSLSIGSSAGQPASPPP